MEENEKEEKEDVRWERMGNTWKRRKKEDKKLEGNAKVVKEEEKEMRRWEMMERLWKTKKREMGR